MVASILAKEVQVATPRPSHHFITSSYCAKAIQFTVIYLKEKVIPGIRMLAIFLEGCIK